MLCVAYEGKQFLTCIIFLILISKGKPTPPVINNKETEINGCNVNLKWSPPRQDACPILKYIVYYREKNSQDSETDWRQIPISQVTKTFLNIPLFCDTKYEFAVSAHNGKMESDLSAYWQVKTNTGVILALTFIS